MSRRKAAHRLNTLSIPGAPTLDDAVYSSPACRAYLQALFVSTEWSTVDAENFAVLWQATRQLQPQGRERPDRI